MFVSCYPTPPLIAGLSLPLSLIYKVRGRTLLLIKIRDTERDRVRVKETTALKPPSMWGRGSLGSNLRQSHGQLVHYPGELLHLPGRAVVYSEQRASLDLGMC